MTKYLAVALVYFFISITICHAQTPHSRYVLFINQVRGSECCDPGSLNALNIQLQSFNKHHYQAAFALRYDALNDPEIIKTLIANPDKHEIAGMLEITPSLAKAAGINYTGDLHKWYLANQAFLIGYAPPDRLKIIDAYMAKFYQVFKYYPKTTIAWMIDAASLNYLHDKYQVKVHQLTREQWGTDSYTMYGGPFHYPYIASRNWPLIPDSVASHNPIIIRQTIADPLYNYGDRRSAYTSQPNDYIRDGKDISYFKNLLNQTLNQTSNPYSLAILGLETSMPQDIQYAYQKQIDYVYQYSQNFPLSVITPSKLAENGAFILPISIVEGKDLIKEQDLKSFWINALNYRARLLLKDQNLYLTDIRIYNKNIPDPYISTKNIRTNGYWIIPFLTDQSRFSDGVEDASKKNSLKNKIHQLFIKNADNFFKANNLLNPQADFLTIKPDYALIHNAESPQINSSANLFQLDFGNNHLIDFSPQNWSVNFPFKPNLPIPNISYDLKNSKWFFGNDGKQYWGFNLSTSNHQTIFTPFVDANLNFEQILKDHAVLFNPQLLTQTTSNLMVYQHNVRSIVDKNPVRLFIKSTDNDLIIPINNLYINFTNNQNLTTTITPPNNDLGIYLLDINSTNPGTYQFSLENDGITTPKYTAIFAPNCRQTPIYCLSHPKQLLQYILTLIETKTRE